MARLNAAWRVINRFHWRCARALVQDVALQEPDGGVTQLTYVRVSGGETRIEGHATAPLVNFATEMEHRVAAPDREGAFDLVILGSRQLVVRAGVTGTDHSVRLYSALDRGINLLRTAAGLLAVLAQWRDIWAYLAQGDSAAGNRLERRLAPVGPAHHVPQAQPMLFDAMHPDRRAPEPVDIVVPVYNAFEETARCLEALAAHTDPRHRVIVVEDASSDPRLRPLVRDWAKTYPNAEVVEHSENRGFVTSVNEGLARARGHVVLLNSDAFVPPGWLPRLLAPIDADAAVASVTPMSSDAEIYTAPVECVRFEPASGQALAMDRVANRMNPTVSCVDAPTGVGFCMAMSKHFLQEFPQLDTVFGRGYGEEVDWCRKTAARGGRHVGIGNLYVEHRGGGSFGAEKLAQIQANNRIINSRYPGYDELVAQFRHHDPLIGPRLALALASIDQDIPVPLYLSQRLGGGSEHWLDREIDQHLQAGTGCGVIRQSDHDDGTVIIEVHCASGVTTGRILADELGDYLSVPKQKRIIYSCLVNADDPLDLMVRVAGSMSERDQFEVLIHDFFPLCPSYNLLSTARQYCALPAGAACQKCYANLPQTSGHRPKRIEDWRAAWKTHLDRADRIIAFSADSSAQISKVWPDLAGKIETRPHALPHLPERVAPPSKGPFVLGVLGAIGYAKGAAVLRDLGGLVDAEFNLVVIGKLDPSYAHKSIVVSGAYAREDISDLARKYGVSGWLIPSVWPETFCYSAHECLATGLPVLAFDIGAQAEAMHSHANGHVVPVGADASAIRSRFLALAQETRKTG